MKKLETKNRVYSSYSPAFYSIKLGNPKQPLGKGNLNIREWLGEREGGGGRGREGGRRGIGSMKIPLKQDFPIITNYYYSQTFNSSRHTPLNTNTLHTHPGPSKGHDRKRKILVKISVESLFHTSYPFPEKN